MIQFQVINQYLQGLGSLICFYGDVQYTEVCENAILSREFVLAGFCDCDFSRDDSEPSHDLCHFLMCQTSHGSWLLPEAEDNPYFQETDGSNLHSRHQLVLDDHVHTCCLHL